MIQKEAKSSISTCEKQNHVWKAWKQSENRKEKAIYILSDQFFLRLFWVWRMLMFLCRNNFDLFDIPIKSPSSYWSFLRYFSAWLNYLLIKLSDRGWEETKLLISRIYWFFTSVKKSLTESEEYDSCCSMSEENLLNFN